MGRRTSTDRRPRMRSILGAGLVTAGLIGGVAYVVDRPAEVELAQATQEPLVDECGARPPKTAPSSTTTVDPSTTSTTLAPTSTTLAPASTTSTTSSSTTSTTVDPTATSIDADAVTTSTTLDPTATTTTDPSDPEAETTTSTSVDDADTTTTSTDDGHWRCTLVEEFEGTALDRDRWVVQTTTGSNFGVGGECFVDSPNNVAVSDGTLKLTVRQEEATVPCPRSDNPGYSTPFTAGSIISRSALDQTYGRYEIRARMPASQVPGLHFAFWLWPRDLTSYPIVFGDGDRDKWANGELDVLEWYSRYPYHQVPYIHYAHTYVQTPSGKWVPDDPNTTAACLVGMMSDWHTYALEWTPTSIRMLYDGKVCLENTHWTPRNTTMPGPFDKPFMVSLTQALGAIGTQNQLVPETPLPATAEVDYLKIWQ